MGAAQIGQRTGNTKKKAFAPLYLYNKNSDYKVYMIPALMTILVILFCGFLPALNIVSEKETGTIDQINVTPIGKGVFILSKLIPYWLIGLAVMTVCARCLSGAVASWISCHRPALSRPLPSSWTVGR